MLKLSSDWDVRKIEKMASCRRSPVVSYPLALVKPHCDDNQSLQIFICCTSHAYGAFRLLVLVLFVLFNSKFLLYLVLCAGSRLNVQRTMLPTIVALFDGDFELGSSTSGQRIFVVVRRRAPLAFSLHKQSLLRNERASVVIWR